MKYIFAFSIFIQSISIFAQFDHNYTPIAYTEEIPEKFLQKLANINKEANSEHLNKKEKDEYLTTNNYVLNQLYQSGTIYFDNEISPYINQVANLVYKSLGHDDKDVQIWLSKMPNANASSWQDGTILINIGLLSWLENEAQLAFVLAHEIIHYEKDHILKAFQLEKDFKKGHVQNGNEFENYMKRVLYSKKQEFDADEHGFELFAKTNYDKSEAVNTLKLLQKVDFDKYQDAIDFDKVFFNSNEKFDSSSIASCLESLKKEVKDSLDIDKDENEDNLSTHPSIEQRIDKINERLLETNLDGSLYLVGTKEKFETYSTIAEFEMVHNSFYRMNYLNSLYLATQLLNTYPENEYLHTIISRSLYWIAYFKTIDNFDNLIPNIEDFPNGPSKHFLCQASSISKDDYVDYAHLYTKYSQQKYPESEILQITLAKCIELINGPKSASKLYNNYTKKYKKEGKYSPHAKIMYNALRSKRK